MQTTPLWLADSLGEVMDNKYPHYIYDAARNVNVMIRDQDLCSSWQYTIG